MRIQIEDIAKTIASASPRLPLRVIKVAYKHWLKSGNKYWTDSAGNKHSVRSRKKWIQKCFFLDKIKPMTYINKATTNYMSIYQGLPPTN